MVHPRKKTSLKARLLLAFSPLILLVLLEMFLWIFAPEPSWDYEVPVLAEMVGDIHGIEGDLHAAMADDPLLELIGKGHELYTEDRLLFWKLKPGYTEEVYNFLSPLVLDPDLRKQGLYERARFRIEVGPGGYAEPVFEKRKSKDTFRILCIGDSNTFGWGVNPEESYPAVLARRLAEALPDKKLEIINMGVPGYTSLQGRVLVEQEVLDLEPDLVIVEYGFNDRWLVSRSDAVNLERARGAVGWLVHRLNQSRILLFTRYWINRSLNAPAGRSERGDAVVLTEEEIKKRREGKVRRVSPEEFGVNIGRLCDGLQARGVQVFLLDMYCQGAWEGAMRTADGSRNIPFIDGEGFLEGLLEKVEAGDPAFEGIKEWAVEKYTASALEKDRRFYLFNDNCHANPEGYRRLAGLVAEEVVRACFSGR